MLRINPARDGFTLLETLIAVGIFAFAALGLLAALDGAVSAAVMVQRQAAVRGQIESLTARMAVGPFQEGSTNVMINGVEYEQEIAREELRSRDNTILPGYWRLRVVAKWNEGGQEQEWTVSHLEYFP